MWQKGTVLGGRYTLAGRIGGGGMGEVWRAEDGVLERSVAVKILLPALVADRTFAERFRREAKLLAALSHPGVVDVHDYGESEVEDGRIAYIVMELVEGRTLSSVRAAEGSLPPRRALDIVAQALDALHAAHRRGITHRDVKPSNLMVREDDRVTVTDFGIARATTSTKITASHAVLGTALYMAPEQAEGGTAGPAADMYAMGVVCYELLTGKPPFGGTSVFDVVLKHIREPAPTLPIVFPERIREFVARALRKDPEDRYADASAMAAAARAAADSADAIAAAVAVTSAGAITWTTSEVAPEAPPDATADESPDAVRNASADAAPEPGPSRTPALKAGPDPAPTPSSTTATTAPVPVGSLPPATAAPVRTDAADDQAAPKPAATPAPDGSGDAKPVPVTSPDGSGAPPTTDNTGRGRRRAMAIALVTLGVVAGIVTTVLLASPDGNSKASGTGGGQPVAATSSQGGDAAPGAAPNSTAPNGHSPSTPSGGAATAPSGGAATSPTAPANASPAPQGRPNPGTGEAPPSATGSSGTKPSTGPATGGNAAPGTSAPVGGTNGGAAPPHSPAPPPSSPATGPPPGCGGTTWSLITNVASGAGLGFNADSPTPGTPLVSGGTTKFGWVRATNQYVAFHACSLSGPKLNAGSSPGSTTPPAELAGDFALGTSWQLQKATTPGAQVIANHIGSHCLQDNGIGRPITVASCTQGNKSQEWYLR